jgi:hypothetical protein
MTHVKVCTMLKFTQKRRQQQLGCQSTRFYVKFIHFLQLSSKHILMMFITFDFTHIKSTTTSVNNSIQHFLNIYLTQKSERDCE